ncbi:MAG: serine protease [Elusimicrobiales bacterium]
MFGGLASGVPIYGDDDRQDYFQTTPAIRKLADSVVSLWTASDLTPGPGGSSYRLNLLNYGEVNELCPGEAFSEQPTGGFCSGFLAGGDLIVTAGHCIENLTECADTRFVFGFKLKSAGESVVSVSASEVYSCAAIVGRSSDPDYAVIRLDRTVDGKKPLAITGKTGVSKGDKVFAIGHPDGLPLKIAGGAVVRGSSQRGYFTTDLDAFEGNSGSPVFNYETRRVEGVLVRGDRDFRRKGDCSAAVVLPQDGGRGEDVTRISELSGYLPSPLEGK